MSLHYDLDLAKLIFLNVILAHDIAQLYHIWLQWFSISEKVI